MLSFGFWRHKDDSIDLLLVVVESLDNFTHFEIPNYNLGIFTGACNKPVAFAYANVNDEISMSMETRLKCQRISIPNFKNAKQERIRLRNKLCRGS